MMLRRGSVLFVAVAMVAILSGCQEKSKELTITGIEPKVGPAMGGDPVIIRGSGFQTPGPKGLTVYFGKNKGRNPVILSDSEIRVDPPGGDVDQTVDVEVIFDDSRAGKLKEAYTYIDPSQRPDLLEGFKEE